MEQNPSSVTNGKPVAIVGAGLVGSGWGIVFARGGLSVRLFDAQPGAAESALITIGRQLQDLLSFGLVDDVSAIMSRFTIANTLAEAVGGVAYVQESVQERVEIKTDVMTELDKLCDETVTIGSSTSGIPASLFTRGLAIAPRVLIAHPVNPPYLVPVVELVPSPATLPSAVHFVRRLMESLGQSIVYVRKEVEGFVLNRIQGALLREAWALVEDGVATCEDIDKTVRDGLGWRWSFMGPFETIDLNAPGGIKDYAMRLGPLYHSIARSRQQFEPWSEDLMDEVEKQRREVLTEDKLAERRSWRDRQLMAMAAKVKSQGQEL